MPVSVHISSVTPNPHPQAYKREKKNYSDQWDSAMVEVNGLTLAVGSVVTDITLITFVAYPSWIAGTDPSWITSFWICSQATIAFYSKVRKKKNKNKTRFRKFNISKTKKKKKKNYHHSSGQNVQEHIQCICLQHSWTRKCIYLARHTACPGHVHCNYKLIWRRGRKKKVEFKKSWKKGISR